MRLLRLFSLVTSIALGAACNQVDYIELRPENVLLRTRSDEMWMQAKAMSHTGVHYSRALINWSTKDPSINPR